MSSSPRRHGAKHHVDACRCRSSDSNRKGRALARMARVGDSFETATPTVGIFMVYGPATPHFPSSTVTPFVLSALVTWAFNQRRALRD